MKEEGEPERCEMATGLTALQGKLRLRRGEAVSYLFTFLGFSLGVPPSAATKSSSSSSSKSINSSKLAMGRSLGTTRPLSPESNIRKPCEADRRTFIRKNIHSAPSLYVYNRRQLDAYPRGKRSCDWSRPESMTWQKHRDRILRISCNAPLDSLTTCIRRNRFLRGIKQNAKMPKGKRKR